MYIVSLVVLIVVLSFIFFDFTRVIYSFCPEEGGLENLTI